MNEKPLCAVYCPIFMKLKTKVYNENMFLQVQHFEDTEGLLIYCCCRKTVYFLNKILKDNYDSLFDINRKIQLVFIQWVFCLMG